MSTPVRRVLYGEANYRDMVEENGYYVDKTDYIRLLEQYKSPVFLRPRRFGKSLLCTMLQYYYDINEEPRFEQLFGHTNIGAHPTDEHSSYFVLHFDFSVVDPSGSIEDIKNRFNHHINVVLNEFSLINQHRFPNPVTIDLTSDPVDNLTYLSSLRVASNLPPFYIIIDEYDNFSNQLITQRRDQVYAQLTADDSFLKGFFKALKNGRKNRNIARIFITGVLPITMDDLASGYNIANFITLHPKFEAMLGFSQTEVDTLLDTIYSDYALDKETRLQVADVIKSNYNGYHFVEPRGTSLYNSTILMFFLEKLTDLKCIPEFLTDVNLKTDISWIRRLTSSNPQHTKDLVGQLTIENRLRYSKAQLIEKFDMSQFFEKSFYPISFFYLGMLTKKDDYYMQLPNINMKAIFSEYFNEVHHVDMATRYAEMMSAFDASPDLPKLFGDYWTHYISQLPEAVFASVNENFYRTTFYDLCRQFLSHLYIWRMESSYPGGRSDLEMEGKYHTRFARDRYLMEFKYISNSQADRRKLKIVDFVAPEQDRKQLMTYHRAQREEYPEQRIQSFLIYCFGNRGFRVFPQENQDPLDPR